jgi:hypothetical protein
MNKPGVLDKEDKYTQPIDRVPPISNGLIKRVK